MSTSYRATVTVGIQVDPETTFYRDTDHGRELLPQYVGLMEDEFDPGEVPLQIGSLTLCRVTGDVYVLGVRLGKVSDYKPRLIPIPSAPIATAFRQVMVAAAELELSGLPMLFLAMDVG